MSSSAVTLAGAPKDTPFLGSDGTIALPWLNYLNGLGAALEATTSSSAGASITVLDLGIITTGITITDALAGVSPTVGMLLLVYGQMDGIGHTVNWDTDFQWPPIIDTTILVGFSALFAGTGTMWVLAAEPVVGASL